MVLKAGWRPEAQDLPLPSHTEAALASVPRSPDQASRRAGPVPLDSGPTATVTLTEES